jgi:hypothetical protein
MKRSALDDPSLDSYTRYVLSEIEPDVFASLADHQYAAVRHAIEKARPISQHPIDIRGVIPLLFARFYFVVLAGRDSRDRTRLSEQRRRHFLASAFGAVVLGTAILLPVTVILLLIGYGLKSFLGVDMDPNNHISDFLR